MIKNRPIYIFVILLIAIVSIAISVVVYEYNKNKPIVPDKYIEVSSSYDAQKIKSAYETDAKKQEFLKLCGSIELAVANKFLDGSVTNETELESAIQKINGVLKSEDWSYLGLESSNYWMGSWQLNSQGTITFTFKTQEIMPDWAKDDDVQQYIK